MLRHGRLLPRVEPHVCGRGLCLRFVRLVFRGCGEGLQDIRGNSLVYSNRSACNCHRPNCILGGHPAGRRRRIRFLLGSRMYGPICTSSILHCIRYDGRQDARQRIACNRLSFRVLLLPALNRCLFCCLSLFCDLLLLGHRCCLLPSLSRRFSLCRCVFQVLVIVALFLGHSCCLSLCLCLCVFQVLVTALLILSHNCRLSLRLCRCLFQVLLVTAQAKLGREPAEDSAGFVAGALRLLLLLLLYL
mmetsp:Transcript_29955/g.84500  ORF Transcript_29955/g.84500 Transcript_29955/m.84500 type:complete len:246 (-) Transcript_29955:87-824(-)